MAAVDPLPNPSSFIVCHRKGRAVDADKPVCCCEQPYVEMLNAHHAGECNRVASSLWLL